jgi:hypothetical protein
MTTLYRSMLLTSTNCHCMLSFIFLFFFSISFFFSHNFFFALVYNHNHSHNHNHLLATQSTRITSQSNTRIPIQLNHKTLRKIHKNHNTILKSSSKNQSAPPPCRPRWYISDNAHIIPIPSMNTTHTTLTMPLERN